MSETAQSSNHNISILSGVGALSVVFGLVLLAGLFLAARGGGSREVAAGPTGR